VLLSKTLFDLLSNPVSEDFATEPDVEKGLGSLSSLFMITVTGKALGSEVIKSPSSGPVTARKVCCMFMVQIWCEHALKLHLLHCAEYG
jgi:hypothetical protein